MIISDAENLSEEAQYFRSILSNLHESIALIDRSYKITDVNITFLNITGFKREQVIGRNCYWIAHGYKEPCDKHGEECLLEKVFKTKKPQNFLDEHKNADGSGYFKNILLSPMEDERGNVTHVIKSIRDATDLLDLKGNLEKERHRLSERVKDLNLLYQISELVEMPGASLEKIARVVVDLIPLAWQYPEIACARIILDSQEFRTNPFGESQWMQASDIHVHGKKAGTVQVYYLEPKPPEDEGVFQKEERQLLDEVAERLGTVIEHKLAEMALKTRLKYEEGLARFSQSLLNESKETLKEALNHLLNVSGAGRVYIFENFESNKDGMCMRRIIESCAPGIKPEIDNPQLQHLPYKDRFSRWVEVLAQGEPIQGIVTSFPQIERRILQAQDIQSILILPIIVRNRWYGFIGFDDTQTKREWDEEDIRLLEIAAQRIGIYIEQKETAEALIKSERKYRSIFDESKDMIITSSVDGKVLDINKAGAEMLGFSSRSDLINTSVENRYLNQSDREQFKRQMEEKGYVKDFEIIMKRKDESRVVGLETATTFEDQNGKVIGYQSIIKDITERIETEMHIWKTNMELLETNSKLKQTQSQLVQQEKLASIGQLAAGVAHEINNPLGFVKSNFTTLKAYLCSIKKYIQMMKDFLPNWRRTENVEEIIKSLQQISAKDEELDVNYIMEDIDGLFEESEDGFNRIITIIQNLKNFSRVDFLGEVESYDLNKAIENILVVARNEYKYVAEVEKDFAEVPLIECVGSEINQVLLNIIVNAAQAIKSQDREDMGIILIKTQAVNDYAVCKISDDGPGIPEEIQARIFDPFFTTKEAGMGTGLGLSISYDIVVNKHEGNIAVHSEKNKGTTITIQLPFHSNIKEKTRQ